MTDLTEQWKKGKLPEGHYYIKTHNETTIDEYIQWYKDHGIPSEKSFAYFNVQQVLAPVPTFDEWEQLQNWADFTNDYHELREKLEIAEYKNAQLKELLKECLEVLKMVQGETIYFPRTVDECIDKINQVLGEDK